MALSAPTRLNGTSTVDGGALPITSGSFTPTADALLVVTAFFTRGTAATTLAISDNTGGAITWTERIEVWANNTTNYGGFALYTGQAPSSPSAMTVTITAAANCNHRMVAVDEVTGFDTTTPVQQTANNNSTTTGLTVTLGSTPGASSMVYGAVGTYVLDGGGITPGTGFTEVAEVVTPTANDATMQSQYDLTSADTTCDWSTLGNTLSVGGAIEINEASGGGGGDVPAGYYLHYYRSVVTEEAA